MPNASLVAVLAGPRKNGWTAQLLKAAVERARAIKGVETDLVYLEDYTLSPCKSCWSCIRSDQHRCALKDDMGGEGKLFAKLDRANGILLATPVFLWGSSAATHVFLERMYPFIWSGRLSGMPFASIACASNSGFQYQANQDVAKQIFNFSLRYLGCVSVHLSYFKQGLAMAEAKGEEMARAALADHQDGRKSLTDREKFTLYNAPWNAVDSYIDNLTNGTGESRDAMPRRALEKSTFVRPRALEVLKRADARIQEAFALLDAGRQEEAVVALSDGSALWTEATWREFLEEGVIGVQKPAAYRPIDNE